MAATFTLGTSWTDQYVAALVLLNTLLGYPGSVAKIETPESALVTLRNIAAGTYSPAPSHGVGNQNTPEMILQPPALSPSHNHLVFVLNASTAMGDFVSVETGGIIFEDPAWAVFAAHAIAQNPRRAVPLASGSTQLWLRLGSLRSAIAQKRYSPKDFFGDISGLIPPASPPEFKLIEVTSEQLTNLRERGVQSFGKPVRFYELFQKPPL